MTVASHLAQLSGSSGVAKKIGSSIRNKLPTSWKNLRSIQIVPPSRVIVGLGPGNAALKPLLNSRSMNWDLNVLLSQDTNDGSFDRTSGGLNTVVLASSNTASCFSAAGHSRSAICVPVWAEGRWLPGRRKPSEQSRGRAGVVRSKQQKAPQQTQAKVCKL